MAHPKKTKPLTIFLPINIHSTGGVSSFAKKLKTGLTKRGHNIVFKYQSNYDLLLVSPRCQWRYLLNAKIRKKPILHRLDGVFYPTTVAGWRYPLRNARFKAIQLFFANYTIYQSRYSIHCCKIFLGTNNNRSSLIYNGVSTNLFSPTGETKQLRDNPQQHIFITTGCFRRQDQVEPLIKAFNKYRKHYFSNSRLIFIGDYIGKVKHTPKTHHKNKNIIFMGTIDNSDLPAYLRSADAFVFSMQNPACPNNIIEAMSCGLPICGVADGSMPELTISGKTSKLVPTKGEAFFRWRNINTSTFAQNINTIMKNKNQYAWASRERAIEHFDVETMTDKYLSVINNLLNKNNNA